ncbi:hypothetical protein CRUP_034399, partial [Coryphaenoides rupestris]
MESGFQLIEDLSYEDVKRCYRGSPPSVDDTEPLPHAATAVASPVVAGVLRMCRALLAPGGGVQCVSCSGVLQAFDVREYAYVYGANVLSLVQSSRPLRDRVASVAGGSSRGGGAGGGGDGGGAGGAGGAGGGGGVVEAGGSSKELLMTLPCPSAQT